MEETKQQRAERKRLAQEVAGIPDSKPFIAEETAQQVSRIETCHINGVAIADMNLDPQVLAALDYLMTDEGIAEKNSRPDVREPSGVTLGQDPFSKALQQRKDDVRDRGFDTYESRDPLKEVADRHAVPGMRPKFLSQARLKDSGGPGDYTIVKDANGDPVKVKGMVLGHIPEDRARARNKHFASRGNKLLNEIGEKYKQEGGSTAVADQ